MPVHTLRRVTGYDGQWPQVAGICHLDQRGQILPASHQPLARRSRVAQFYRSLLVGAPPTAPGALDAQSSLRRAIEPSTLAADQRHDQPALRTWAQQAPPLPEFATLPITIPAAALTPDRTSHFAILIRPHCANQLEFGNHLE